MNSSKNKKKNATGRKTLAAVVVSDKMNKTRVVEVQRLLRHRRYGKVVKKNKKFYAHDEKNSSSVGDKVVIEESRPMSKLKRWRIIRIEDSK